MPVYLRNALTITPPSISELPDDDMDDFLQDPDQLKDKLPQPFKYIDRILNNVFEKAWDFISTRERERIAEASRIRPPQYQTTIKIEEHGATNCLCESADGKFVAAGTVRGLIVLDAMTQTTVDSWLQDDMSLQRLQFTLLKEDIHLISSVDDCGVARLFGLAGGKIYLLHAFNEAQVSRRSRVVGLVTINHLTAKEPKEETEAPNITASKCEASFDGSFVGIYFENATSRENYLEVHKCPRDVWIKELDAQVAKETANKEQTAASPQPHKEAEAPTSPSAGDITANEGETEPTSGTQKQRKSRATKKIKGAVAISRLGMAASRGPTTGRKSKTAAEPGKKSTKTRRRSVEQVVREKVIPTVKLGMQNSPTSKSRSPDARSSERHSTGEEEQTEHRTSSSAIIQAKAMPTIQLNMSKSKSRSPDGQSPDGPKDRHSPRRSSVEIIQAKLMPNIRLGSRLGSRQSRTDTDHPKTSSKPLSGSRSPSVSRSPSASRLNSSRLGNRDSSQSPGKISSSLSPGSRMSQTSSRLDIRSARGRKSPAAASEKATTEEAAEVVAPEGGEKSSIKFSPSNIVFRLRPPAPVQAAPIGQPPQLAKDSGDVIGLGLNHLLSAGHLEGRNSSFTHLHSHHLKFLPKDFDQVDNVPQFHFLTPGRMMMQGLENPANSGVPNTIALWWSRSHNLVHYSLTGKSGKDEEENVNLGKSVKKSKKGSAEDHDAEDTHYVEDYSYLRQRSKISHTSFTLTTSRSRRSASSRASSIMPEPRPRRGEQEPRPDCVWPVSHAIIASAVTPDTSLIALGLENGSIVVWDKNLGMVRRVVHLTSETEIRQITFLSPSICPQDSGNYPPYGVNANVYLLVTCADSQMYLVECKLGKHEAPTRVTPPIENKDERYVEIKPIPGIPHLVMACRQDGCVYLINLFGGRVIAEVTLPNELAIASPSKPVIAVGGMGQTLYVQAERKSFEEETESESSHALCALSVRSYNALDRHRTKQRPTVPYTIHSTAQERIDALFAERLTQQPMRKDRMQARWGQMKTDFELMLQLRKEATQRVNTRVAYTASSIEQSVFREAMSPNPFFGI